VLVETNYMNPTDNMQELCFNMIMAGYQPVLAHPERYVYMYDDFEQYYDIARRDILLQVNLASLAGYYSKTAKKIAERLIKEKMVHFVGTDIHHLRHIDPLKNAMQNPAYRTLADENLYNHTLA
jgi:tyrosine-protein phosphatase YwqE